MCLHDHLKPVGLAPCQRKEKGEGFQKASTTATGGRMPPRLTQCNIEKGDRGTDWWIAKPMAFWTQAIFLSPRADSAISRPDVPKGIWPMQRSGISVGSDQRPSRWVSAGEQICHIGSNGLFHPLPCGNPVRQAADDQLFFFFFFFTWTFATSQWRRVSLLMLPEGTRNQVSRRILSQFRSGYAMEDEKHQREPQRNSGSKDHPPLGD